MIGKPVCCALALVALLGPGMAQARPGTATKYRPANLFGGYSEKLVEPGVWRVKAKANGIAEPGFAQNMAIYRAAELMRQQGFAFLQVVDQKGEAMSMRIGGGSPVSAGQSMILWVRGAQDAGAPATCRAKEPGRCFTVPVARTLDRVRPFLTFPEDGS